MRFLLLALLSVLGTAIGQEPFADAEAIRGQLGKRTGVIVLRDCASGEVLCTDEALAGQPFVPCSTFKIWNTAIGLEAGLVEGPAALFWTWDGQKRWLDAWNHDQTLRSAFQVSCVPAYQNLARRIGPERMQGWLAKLPYGDADMSAGVDVFWLPKPGRKTVLITPEEQAALLCRLAEGKVPFSEETQQVLKDVMKVEATEKGALYGKTGSGVDANDKLNLGWYVGYVESEGRMVAFAVLLTGSGASGVEARQIAKRLFRELGWL